MDKHHHFIIHKPLEYLSQFVSNQNKQRNKKLLADLHDFPEDTIAIGRLDQDSEGFLLLTTDGKMSELVRSKQIDKKYYIQVDGEMTRGAIERLKNVVEISIRSKKTQRYHVLPPV